ncbi:MAG: hypothetical protein GF403_01780 [Candidatus Coatesbacteria bacterium]|nr:hypothetical protein [Candidatus Coatesbacteria bacterium]
MKTIGYLQGVEPELLTRLNLEGLGTLPLGNGWDNHGKYINHLTPKDGVDAVVGYLHKVVSPDVSTNKPKLDILFSCLTHSIPVYLIVPKEQHENARKWIGDDENRLHFIDPAEVFEALRKA